MEKWGQTIDFFGDPIYIRNMMCLYCDNLIPNGSNRVDAGPGSPP